MKRLARLVVPDAALRWAWLTLGDSFDAMLRAKLWAAYRRAEARVWAEVDRLLGL